MSERISAILRTDDFRGDHSADVSIALEVDETILMGDTKQMILGVKYSGAKNDPGDVYQNSVTLVLDGVEIARGRDFSDCPEDANLGRGLRWLYKLPGVLRRVHAAGATGEPLVVEETEGVDW